MPTPGELSHSALPETDPGSRLEDLHGPSQPIHFTGVRRILRPLLRSHTNLRLRTKLLLSLVLSTTALTCATLLVVRHSAQSQVQRQIEQDVRNAFLTIQAVHHQREMMLSHKADLLATLAYLRDGDATTVQDASQDPWQSGDCDLFALADRRGKIVALHSTSSRLSVADAETLFRRSLKDDSSGGWWFAGRHLFQVVLQPYYEDEPRKSRLLGTVIVGRELDARGASDLGRISSSHLIFRYGNDLVMTTFAPAEEEELKRQLRDNPTGQNIQIGEQRFFASSLALASGTQPALSLTVLKSYDEATASLKRLNHLLVGLGLAAVLGGGLLVFVISDRSTRPLAYLAEGVRALEQGDFTYPLKSDGGDEVAHVTRAFEEMRSTLQRNEVQRQQHEIQRQELEGQRQQLEGQLRQAQKMDAMGRLAGGVAHDFNNLLTVIKGNSSLLVDRMQSDDRLLGCTRQIESAADRAAGLTRQLLAFCRMQVLQPKILDLNMLVSEMCKLLRRLIREDIAFNFHAGESLGRVKADPGQIEQVIMNLAVNAGDAMPAGGSLTIETRNITVDEQFARARPPILRGQYVLLAVNDTGQGMNDETKARIFEPFFTTKEQGKGTGLGLATVYGIVKQSGGCVWVESEPHKGARFEVYLPRVDEAPEPAAGEELAATPARQRKTVLIVEDEEAVRELASEFIHSAGYTVLTAKDGTEALTLAEQSDEPIHLLLTDVVMPKMRGPELAKRLKGLRNTIRVVYMSGYLEYNRGNEDFLEEGFFLQKPFSRDTLVRKVGEALRNNAPAKSVKHSILS
jgi:two-component system cell cycle sensor histidine kinase/response regulator CckA